MLDILKEVFLIILYVTAIFLLLYTVVGIVVQSIKRSKHEKEAKEFAEKCALDFTNLLEESLKEVLEEKKQTKKTTKKVKKEEK